MSVKFPVIGAISFDPRSREEVEFIVQEIVYDGAYLRAPIVLEAGAVVFDVGANVGIFSRFVLARQPDAKLFAFEPVPETFSHLEANLGGRAQLFSCALGGAPGRGTITAFPAMPANATLQPEAKAAELETFRARSLERVDPLLRPLMAPRFDAMFESVEVECEIRTLASVVKEAGIDRIDLLKIDVEGFEAEVLDGIDDATWPRVRQVALETSGEPDAERLRSQLEARGFLVTTETPDFAERMGLVNRELLAVRA